MNQALRNSVVCMKSYCDRAFIHMKETSSQDKEVCIINVFQMFSPSMATYNTVRHPKGENTTSLSLHSPMIIPSVPVTFAKINCGRGSAKDSISLQDSRTRSCKENVF